MSRPHADEGLFVLRTPLLPMHALVSLAPEPPVSDAASYERARDHSRAALSRLLALPELREALALASPSLMEAIPAWEADPRSAAGARLEPALLRYVARASGRETPFGLFAAWSAGIVEPRAELSLAPRASARRQARPDLGWLAALADEIAGRPEIAPLVELIPNNTLYEAGASLVYVEVRREPGRTRHVHSRVRATETIRAALEAAPGTPGELAARLRQVYPSLDEAEARAFIHQLRSDQLLVPALAPRLTADEPLADLIGQVRALREGAAAELAALRSALEALEAAPMSAGPGPLLAARCATAALPPEIGAAPQGRILVDLYRPPIRAALPPALVHRVQRAVALLASLRTPPHRQGALAGVRQRFVERFGDRLVPLGEALDPELGAPLTPERPSVASPLLAGLHLGAADPEGATWTPLQRHILSRVSAGDADPSGEISLSAAELAPFVDPAARPLPASICVWLSLFGAPGQPLERAGVVLEGAGGPSGARALARAATLDPALRAGVQRHLDAEAADQGGAIVAEIVHRPEGGATNASARPAFLGWEIPYLSPSSLPPDRQIPVSDLLLSVEDGRFVLRSRRLGREVVPRLSTAHNFDAIAALPLYRFLAMLQSQGTTGAALDRGPLDELPHLPRISIDGVVVSRARWRLLEHELRALAKNSGFERFEAVTRLRGRRRLPRWVALAEHDQELPVDLDNPALVDGFVELVARREQITLIELLPDPDRCVATGPDGRYSAEILLPLRRPVDPRPAALPRALHPDPAACPGSDWLYARIFAGPASADRLLLDHLAPLARALRTEGHIHHWFYIRYGEGGWHLRLRLHGEPDALLSVALPRLLAAHAEARRVGLTRRISLDTYEPEVDRYGGHEATPHAHAIFEADSECAAELAGLARGEAGLDTRWRWGLIGVERLIGDLGLRGQGALALMERQRRGYAREYHIDAARRGEISELFRRERGALEALRRGSGLPERARRALDRRSEEIRLPVAALRALDHEGRLSQPMETIAASLAHMHLNRLLRSAAREQEAVLWDLLERLCRSDLARREPEARPNDRDAAEPIVGERPREGSSSPGDHAGSNAAPPESCALERGDVPRRAPRDEEKLA